MRADSGDVVEESWQVTAGVLGDEGLHQVGGGRDVEDRGGRNKGTGKGGLAPRMWTAKGGAGSQFACLLLLSTVTETRRHGVWLSGLQIYPLYFGGGGRAGSGLRRKGGRKKGEKTSNALGKI